MSIWDDYKTRVRTRINVKQDRLLLTERQWKLKHYVKLNDKCGKYLWVNAYCPNQELYLWDEEVRKMTDEELATYRAEEKEKRVARAKRRELKAEFDKLKKQKLDKSSTERRSFNMIKAMRNKIINNSVCIAKTVDIALYDYKENFVADFDSAYPDELSSKYLIWIAAPNTSYSDFPSYVDIHQYSWNGKVNGIPEKVDMNYIYNLNC